MIPTLTAIFLLAFFAGYLWQEKKRADRQAKSVKGIVSAFCMSKEDHEKKGGATCEKCKKEFYPSGLYCTWDFVMTKDGDAFWYSCPHCQHSWTVPMKTKRVI